MKIPRVVTSAFIRKGDKYLLVYDPRFEFWRVPGGRLKFGEDVEKALARELKEELGAEVEIKRFIGFGQDAVGYSRGKFQTARVILYFECISLGDIKPLSSDEISEMKWVTISEIKKQQNLEPAIIDLFRRFDII